ncbi:MAG: hypothetical protein IJ089_02610 [Clostridia bacterium]|nr:hypothetical protein [Clostridia bacterium]
MEEFLKRDGAYSTFDTQRMLEALYGSLKEAKQTGDILDELGHLAFDLPEEVGYPADLTVPTGMGFGPEFEIPTGLEFGLEDVVGMECPDELTGLIPEFESELKAAYEMLDALGFQEASQQDVEQILFQNLSREHLNFIDLLRFWYRLRKQQSKKLCRRLIRRIRSNIKILLYGLWRARISTASRANANSSDKMLMTVPTPPTDKVTNDVSYQWGGGVIAFPI